MTMNNCLGWMLLFIAGVLLWVPGLPGQVADKAKLEAARAEVKKATAAYDRILKLSKAIPPEELDQSQIRMEEAKFQLASLEKKPGPVLLEHLGKIATVHQNRLK